MTAVCTDEHVPSVFVTTLRSNGYKIVRAVEILGEGTDDRQLLAYCGEQEHVLIIRGKKDFGGPIGNSVAHAGIVIYTDPVFLRREPGSAVRTLERVLEQ